MAACSNVAALHECWRDADGNEVTLEKHIQYALQTDGSYKPKGFVYLPEGTQYNGTDVGLDVSTWTFQYAGACQRPQPDAQCIEFCDLRDDGSKEKFYRPKIFTFDSDGEIAGMTLGDPIVFNETTGEAEPYVVLGTEGDCDACPLLPVGQITVFTGDFADSGTTPSGGKGASRPVTEEV